jgi:O-antigen ligase
VSITAVVVLAVYGLGLVLALVKHPIFALFSYLWIFYNHPPAFWWGDQVPDLRYSFIAAAVALVATVRIPRSGAPPFLDDTGAKLIAAYALWMWCQTPWAVNVQAHLEGAILATKYVVLYYVIRRIVTDAKLLESFLWVHVAGCSLLGWLAFRSNVRGRLDTLGGPGVDDGNLLAAQLLTGAAIAGFLFIGCRGYRRWAALLGIPFILNAIILTQSRGAFVALVACVPVVFYLVPRAARRFVSVAVMLGAVLFLALSHEELWERVATLFEIDLRSSPPAEVEVRSTQETRLSILGPQFHMFLDYPLGAGHRGNEFLSPLYMDEENLAAHVGRRSAHNTFMAALVDQGLPGAVLLVWLYLWAARSLLRLKRMDTQGLSLSLGIFRAAIGTALVSCFVSGLFLNMLKMEVQVWLVALLAILISESARPSDRSIEGALPHAGTGRQCH